MSSAEPASLGRRMAAEFVGTGLLLMAIVGSGIAAQSLVPEPVGVQLLINALATGLVLAAAIWITMAVSGAHLNPAVTLVDLVSGGRRAPEAMGYLGAQVAGACTGAILANLMFDLPAVSLAATERMGPHLLLSEVVATAALVVLIFALVRTSRTAAIPAAVGAFVAGAILFSSSTAFANPAVTLARSLTDTFSGISPASVPGFLAAELIGAVLALLLLRVLYPIKEAASDE